MGCCIPRPMKLVRPPCINDIDHTLVLIPNFIKSTFDSFFCSIRCFTNIARWWFFFLIHQTKHFDQRTTKFKCPDITRSTLKLYVENPLVSFLWNILSLASLLSQIKAMESQFPEEIIVEILIRLPVLSLLHFKCVSKSWKALISDPYFKAKHCNHAKNNKKVLITQRYPEVGFSYYSSSLSSSSAQPLQKLGYTTSHKPCSYVILCCCDGLSLLWCRAGHLLWNPSTNESVELPNHEHPEATRSTYGLGYDSISDDYKILAIDNAGGGSRSLNKIFALKSGSWRNTDNHPRAFCNSVRPEDSLAFICGAFHWICKDNYSKYFMVSFNISDEVYGEISLPEGICNISNWISVKTWRFSIRRSALCLLYFPKLGGCGHF